MRPFLWDSRCKSYDQLQEFNKKSVGDGVDISIHRSKERSRAYIYKALESSAELYKNDIEKKKRENENYVPDLKDMRTLAEIISILDSIETENFSE